MRIIQGQQKNRRFTMPKNLKIRPTTDLAKESLFNILENMYTLNNLEILGLFSGSGNITYEFCSRGSNVTSVEINKKCINFIKKTSKDLEVQNIIIHKDCLRFLKTCSSQYDIIFADPPFNSSKEIYSDLIKIIFGKDLIKKNGILIIEHSSFLNFKMLEQFLKTKKYGDVNFSFLKK